MSSPRGRIYLMKAVNEGALDIANPLVQEHELSCLVCRACETACPSGVQYSVLMEHTREAIAQTGSRGPLHRFVYTNVLGSRVLTRLGQFCLALLSRTRLLALARKTFDTSTGIFAPLRITPDSIPFPHDRDGVYPTTKQRIGSVGILIGCIGDVFTKQVNDATITVLNALGYDVHTVPEISCCGALASHAGYGEHTRTLARTTLDTIERSGVDYFITNIAGCGAMMKDYSKMLGASHPAQSKIKDISEFLYEHHLSDLERLGLHFDEPTHIAYHAPCHLYHGQKIVDLPARLLRTIANAEVTILEENDICCGSAGTYNVERPEMASELLARKMEIIGTAGAPVVATANAGCLLQLQSGLRERYTSAQAYHFIELIASRIQA